MVFNIKEYTRDDVTVLLLVNNFQDSYDKFYK